MHDAGVTHECVTPYLYFQITDKEGYEIMLSNHKLQVTLEEIKEISRIELALYSDKGKLLASTYEEESDMEDAIRLFADSMAESQMLSGCHIF